MGIRFRHYDAASAGDILETVIAPLYEASHADMSSNEFYSLERAVERTRGYLRAPGFALVVAYLEDDPIGQAFGYPLPATTRWWTGLTTPVPDDLIHETGTRTFAFNEVNVLPERQGQGVAHALHDELLNSRPEERATLLVREDNTIAQNAYARWGWKKIGKLQPYPDSPHFDAMILPLPLMSGDAGHSAAGTESG